MLVSAEIGVDTNLTGMSIEFIDHSFIPVFEDELPDIHGISLSFEDIDAETTFPDILELRGFSMELHNRLAETLFTIVPDN